jgi:hypothetical protein
MPHAKLSAAIGEQLDDLPVDEEIGSLTRPPHTRLCLLRDPGSMADALESEELEDEDLDFLCEQAGVIVTISKDRVTKEAVPHVRYFADEDELEDRWADLCDDLGEVEDDEDEDDEESDDEEE